jgi:hypothetical protein
MTRIQPRRLFLLPVIALAALALAATASAATITLKCGGMGAHGRDSAGTVECAAAPGKRRPLIALVRDDAGKPVKAKVVVTYSRWTPLAGGGYSVAPYRTQTAVTSAGGKLTLPVKTATRTSLKLEVVADEAHAVSSTYAEAEVSRQLLVKVKKLGGGRVKVTVKGGPAKLKVGITDESGYYAHGGAARKASHGSAVFNLGSARGGFEVYVDAGSFSDLFWPSRPSFRL